MIRIEDLSKRFQSKDIETTALDRVNLLVKEGEFISIMGPSGCGKSTLLNLLGLIDGPCDGDYWFLDEQVGRYSEQQRAHLRKNNIGFVFQSFNLIDDLTVFENVELPLIYLNKSKQERKNAVGMILDDLNIAHRARHLPQQLSGGQQQRVAVARAIVHRPILVLADEPTGNLDSEHGSDVMDLLSSLNERGTTIVMVTHSSKDAGRSGKTMRMLDGRIISETNTTTTYA